MNSKIYTWSVFLIPDFYISPLRVILTESYSDKLGIPISLEGILALILCATFLLVGYGFGIKILTTTTFNIEDQLTKSCIAIALGIGGIAYLLFFLGLVKLLTGYVIFIMLILIAVWSKFYWLSLLSSSPYLIRNWVNSWKIENGQNIGYSIFLIFILTLMLFQALTPPWDYDALLYHLPGPMHYMKQGQISMITENWLTNYPFMIEMLFAIGLSVGNDIFAKLINLSFSILLVITTYSLGRKMAGYTAGWLSALTLISIPIYPIWSSVAGIDMAWALFEVLCLYGLLHWEEGKDKRWLALAGVMAGFACSTKYLALGVVATGILWILIRHWKSGMTNLMSYLLIFGATAITVGSPWYLKNLLWTGNPFFPFLFASSQIPVERIQLWLAYMQSFGAGREAADYLLLPIRIYTQHKRFGTFLGSIEIPSFIFPIVICFTWLKRNPVVNGLILFVFIRFVFWSVGSQQIRYLLPLFPALSILSAAAMIQLYENFSKYRGLILIGKSLVLGVFFSGLAYSLIFFFTVKPLPVILGTESRQAFLSRMVDDYDGIRYIQENLPQSARVLMLWDGRNYYCDQRCVPDIDHLQWTTLVLNNQNITNIVSALQKLGITHLLYSNHDTDFNLIHDPKKQNMFAYKILVNQFIPQCGKLIYQDKSIRIFLITCR